MKRHLFILGTILLSFSLLMPVNAQEGHKVQSEASLGTHILSGASQLSPWGAHYRNNYSTGIAATVAARFIFSDNSYLGAKLNMFNGAANYDLAPDKKVADNINLFYVAPQIGDIIYLNKKLMLQSEAGIGYMHYLNEGLLSDDEFKYSSHMMGINTDISLNYFIQKQFSIGLNLGFITSVAGGKELINKIAGANETIKLNKWDRLNFSAMNVSISVKTHF